MRTLGWARRQEARGGGAWAQLAGPDLNALRLVSRRLGQDQLKHAVVEGSIHVVGIDLSRKRDSAGEFTPLPSPPSDLLEQIAAPPDSRSS